MNGLCYVGRRCSHASQGKSREVSRFWTIVAADLGCRCRRCWRCRVISLTVFLPPTLLSSSCSSAFFFLLLLLDIIHQLLSSRIASRPCYGGWTGHHSPHQPIGGGGSNTVHHRQGTAIAPNQSKFKNPASNGIFSNAHNSRI